MNESFYAWQDAKPMETAIDLSQPGETTVRFHQTCSTAHDEVVYFDWQPKGKTESEEEFAEQAKEILKGLSGEIVIRQADGTEVPDLAPIKLGDQFVDSRYGEVVLAYIPVFKTGDYLATIRIETAAPELAGKQQTVFARYRLCGLEQLPAFITAAFAAVIGLAGLVIFLCLLPALYRHGVYQELSGE